MSLVKTPVPINFAQGLNTKVDPKQLQIGKFLDLKNSVFTTEGLLKKRNGYEALASAPNADSQYITTLNGNLTAIGTTVDAYIDGTNTWVSKGSIQPMRVSTLPLIRNNVNQIQCDSVIHSNGYVCTVYSEVNAGVYAYKYVIADSHTGQNIVPPTLFPAGSGVVTGSPRVFLVGNYFVLGFTNLISAVYHLQYISINATSLVTTSPQDIAASYIPYPTVAWDGVVSLASQVLYIAYNTTSGGQAVVVKSLTQGQVAAGSAPGAGNTFAGEVGTMFTLTSDETLISPIIYVNYWDDGTNIARVLSVTSALATNFAPTNTFVSGSLGIANMTTAAQNGICTLLYEVNNTYTYNSSIQTHLITRRTITQAGVVSTGTNVIRSLGLASKAFIIDSIIYFLGVYSTTSTDFTLATSVTSSYQPTYFLINATLSTQAAPIISAKLAYTNGGGYLPYGIPGVTVFGNEVLIPYLFKDLVTSVNKNTNVSAGIQTAGVYAQTGINLASFDITVRAVDTAEIASDLHISGGFLWMYDGYLPVEHNFFLYPENIEATYVAAAVFTPTGTWTSGSNQITVSAATSLAPGMTITGTNIPANAYILSISGTVLTISANTTGSGVATPLTISSHVAAKPDGSTNAGAYAYQITYEWADNQGNIYRSAPSVPVSVTTSGSGTDGIVSVQIPTLRLTYKTSNPVKIAVYRWSVAQQVYYQVTSINYVINNSTTVDSIQFIDTQPDANIIGNNILYTTGGVIEDLNAPATNLITLFDTRLWLVSAEDPNLLWFSKQVIESTPVEMSDLLTFFVAPTIGVQGSTGPITALSAMDDKLVIFKKNAIYYINGTGPDNTGANNQYSQPIFITSSVGSDNQSSIVLTPNGIMFQSDKGIWLLGRDLSVTYIGAPVEQYNSDEVLSAISIPETTQIRFTMESGITLMFDYFYSQWGTFTGMPGVSSCIYENQHTYITEDAGIYQETPGLYLDGANPVLLSFTTSWISLAGLQGFERFYFMFLEGSYYSPFTLSAKLYYDYDVEAFDPYTITPDPTETVFEARLFPSHQKCETFQLVIDESYDSSLSLPPGQGLSLSGMNLVIGQKKGFRTQSAAKSFG